MKKILIFLGIFIFFTVPSFAEIGIGPKLVWPNANFDEHNYDFLLPGIDLLMETRGPIGALGLRIGYAKAEDDSGSNTKKMELLDVVAYYRRYITKSVNLSVGVGVAYASFEYEEHGWFYHNYYDGNKFAPLLNVGLEWYINKYLALSADYHYLNKDDISEYASFSLRLYF